MVCHIKTFQEEKFKSLTSMLSHMQHFQSNNLRGYNVISHCDISRVIIYEVMFEAEI
jgi:hypothetical protein